MDPSGKVVISAKFQRANSFHEGMAAVKVGERWGFINKTGKLVVEAKYDEVRNFSEGYAAVARLLDGRLTWGYINTTGVEFIKPRFTAAGRFSEGFAWVRVTELSDDLLGSIAGMGLLGFIDTKGRFVIQPQFRAGGDFEAGLADVSWDSGGGLIDPKGHLVYRATNVEIFE
jgi:hypothetical protein